MTILNRMTAEANAAAERYGIVVEGWRGLYSQALRDSGFGSQHLLNRTKEQAYEIARIFLTNERVIADRQFDEVASEARTATLREFDVTTALELPDDADEHLSAAVDYLMSEIVIQIERDIAFLVDSVRKTFLSVHISATAQRIPIRTALTEYSIGVAGEIQFFFHDRRNQRWLSRKFIRAVWRHGLLTLYNEIVLMALAEHGLDHGEVRHQDPKSQFDGMKIALYSASQHPTYSEIRSEIFHPNAEAVMGPITEAVDVSP